MTSIVSWTMIGVFLLSLLISSFSNLPNYEVSPGPVGSASLLLLWVLMLIHFFKNRSLKRKVWWGISLIIFSWIAGVIYFWRVYQPNNRVDKIEKFKLANPTFYKYFKIIVVCAIITILHQFFFSNFYLVFGIPFFDTYSLIVEKIIYFPVFVFLSTLYKALNVDLVGAPSRHLFFLGHAVNLLYTMGLYAAVYVLFSKVKRLRHG